MQAHFELNDDTFEHQFDTATLPDALFSHEAHLRLAWIQIERLGLAKASEKVCDQIKRYASSLGEHNKFHRTLTMAAVYVVAHFKDKSVTTSFKELLLEYPELNTNFKGLLLSHYSAATLGAPEARTHYQEPDLIPFT